MRKTLLFIPLLLLALQPSPVASMQAVPTTCITVSDGQVCMEYVQEATETQTPAATVTPAATTQADQIVFELYRNSALPLVGSVSGGAWAFPGAALTANTDKLYASYLQGRTVLLAKWVIAWNPNTDTNPTGVRLVIFDDGPANIVEIARVERTNYHNPLSDGAYITAQIQAVLDAGIDKNLGMQTYGNGANGALVYSFVIDIVIR